MEIRRTLEEFIRTRSKTDEKFQAFVYEELATLKNSIREETQVGPSSAEEGGRGSGWGLMGLVMGPVWVSCRQIRVREDDEIVDALNRYTSKLQQSLKIINSTEM